MGKITTADCKRFLDDHASRFMANTASLLSLQVSGEWVRLRKYKDRDGITCRDFANRGLPVVAILSEEAGELVLKRERALCVWESAFLRQFPDVEIEDDPCWTSWADHVMWPSLRAEDFRFGVGPGPYGNAGEVSFFFQPCGTSEEEPWDQHLPVIHGLIPRQIAGYEIVECSYGFSRQGDPAKYVDVRADLVAAGFTHDRKLDGM